MRAGRPVQVVAVGFALNGEIGDAVSQPRGGRSRSFVLKRLIGEPALVLWREQARECAGVELEATRAGEQGRGFAVVE